VASGFVGWNQIGLGELRKAVGVIGQQQVRLKALERRIRDLERAAGSG